MKRNNRSDDNGDYVNDGDNGGSDGDVTSNKKSVTLIHTYTHTHTKRTFKNQYFLDKKCPQKVCRSH